MGNFPKSLYLCTQKDKRMRKYILADNQEITRFALESLIRQKGENDILRATDKAGLVQLLKEHENAVVLLDYTLFDFADEEQLLIVAERFSLSEWILFSDELTPQFLRRVVYSSHQFSIIFKDGPLKDIRDALDAVNRHNRHISQRALEVIISQQQEDEEHPSIRLPTSVSQVSTPSPPIARTSSANSASIRPTKSSSTPYEQDWWTRQNSIYRESSYLSQMLLLCSIEDQRDRSLIFFHKNLRITLFICIFAAFCRIFKFIYPELA